MPLVRLKTESLDARLTFRAFFPTYLRALVSSYMDIFRREKVCDLGKHVLNELEGLFISRAEDIISDSPHRPDLIRT